MTRVHCTWRDVETGARFCLVPDHDHRPIRRPMVSRPSRRVRLQWRRVARAAGQVVGAGVLAVTAYASVVVLLASGSGS